MDGKRITAGQFMGAIGTDVERMAQKVADALNCAEAGAIIDQSEEPVRDALAEFRRHTYQKAIDLLSESQQVFSPSGRRAPTGWRNKGRQTTTHLTMNGRLTVKRTVLWHRQQGTAVPLDRFLGIEHGAYSRGVREVCCRECLNVAFVPASENIQRLAQLDVSSATVRQIVEGEGAVLSRAQHIGQAGPDFTASACTDQTVIVGADGVMVPLVTERQKQKRRATEAAKRKRQRRRSTARAARPRKGSDGPYKEFKIVAFYDADKTHQYVMGTSGNHQTAGRLLRQIGRQLEIATAKTAYSVSDGTPWIFKQLQIQLPMLAENILDFYHFKEHLIKTGQDLFGEGTAAATAWKDKMVTVGLEQGSLVLLDRLGDCLATTTEAQKQQALKAVRDYIAKRVAMTDYPAFVEQGYDIGSGPTESFCGCLTSRLKGSGMRWDKNNAEAIMGLASLYYSNQWDNYWKLEQKAA